MANAFEQTDLVMKIAIKKFLNNLQLANKVDRQLDSKNVFNGDTGETIRIRRPVMFKSTEGAQILAGQISDIEEATVPVTVDQRHKVVHALTSEEKTLNISDYTERVINPSMEELAQLVESDIAGFYKWVPNIVGTPGTIPGSFLTIAQAGAVLNRLGVSMMTPRSAFIDPDAMVALSDNLKDATPSDIAKTALEMANIGIYGGFTIYENQSLKAHTVGNYSGTPLIKGGSQDVTYAQCKNTWTQTLETDGWTPSVTGLLKAGDIIEIDGVYEVNRRTRESTGNLARFVVVDDVDSNGAGEATLTIRYPIIVDGPYQTVSAVPADDADITIKTGNANSVHRQHLAFNPNWFTLAFAQLSMPGGGAKASRMNYKGISMRVVVQYDITLDKDVMRFDIFYGRAPQNSEFCVRITG